MILQGLRAQSLLDLALQKELQKSRMWSRLLHYERNIWGQKQSQVKSAGFFLHSLGQMSLKDELAATLKSFFDTRELADQHPICRFPARYAWLKTVLSEHPDWSKLPKPNCRYLSEFRKSLAAHSISFVFSSYHAGNPGSTFGHTFFRINKRRQAETENPELLDFGVSYAADVTTENSILYVWKGLWGGFRGTVTSLPYYFKVREYNDYDSRDLWSYELNLTSAEVEQFVNHLWEIGPHHFDYYFFTQNCSYHMLTLLEVASNRWELTDEVPFYVIPSDAIKAMVEQTGLVKQVDFRPSVKRVFQEKWTRLSDSEKKLGKELLSQPSDRIAVVLKGLEDEKRRADVLDALVDYIDWQHSNGVHQKQGLWYDKKQVMSQLRAETKVISEATPVETPRNEQPDSAHPSARIAFGASGKTRYLGFRFAFHEILDSADGLPKYSQVEFGHFNWEINDRRITWNRFSLFNLLQLNPITEMDKRLSWGVDVGIIRLNKDFAPGMKVQSGVSVEWREQLFWMMPTLEYRYTESQKERNRLSAGCEFSFVFVWSQSLKIKATYLLEKTNAGEMNYIGNVMLRYNGSKNLSFEVTSEDDRPKGTLYYFF